MKCDCVPCESSNADQNRLSKCRRNRVCYSAKCKNCDLNGIERVYHGETARNLCVRSKEHYNALNKCSQNSFMWNHIKSDHGGKVEGIKFEWQVTGKFVKPLQGQVQKL